MSSKNLTFKLIMDGDSKGLVAAAKQSKDVSKKLFETIESEAERLKKTSAETAKEIGKIIPADLPKKADQAKGKLDELGSEFQDVASTAKDTGQEIGNIIPKNASERASALIKSLNETTEIIKSTGTGVIGASESFNKFSVDSVRSLNLLKANLATAKTKLEEFSRTNATPEDIAKAQQQINALEKEVQQADQAFGAFKSELSLITPEATKLDAELGKTNAELQKSETLVKQASVEIQGLKTGYTALTSAMAALGVGVSAAEIGRTADEFKVLEARIGLATSKSGNFTDAFEGVKKIAIETRSNLTATAELFTRVKSAVDQLGYSQERALGITDLVNKSLIVGGGLAASNEAAIYQFNQALQSGVLRGEEFNSVMEQAPRLARALADGLGVNVGKLREMAGQGKLTSEVIVKALESQSKALNEEFAKMPITIGQSIENLKTAWTLYIGEADAATGASAKVAEALKFVAENLDQIVSTLVLAGQTFIAYKALNIASVFLDKAAGVRVASVAITQETVAVVANTQAQIANATATKSAAASKVQLAANSAAATTASIATSGSIMTLISRLGALGVAVTAVGVLVPTVFQPIGTAIGEGVAKGIEHAEIAISNLGTSAGDANRKVLTSIEQLESQMKAEEAAVKAAAEVKQSFALAAEKARDKAYQLTVESKKLVTEFDALIKKGEPTKEALEKISNAMKFDSTKGINDSVTALILLKDQGKITAEELQLRLGQALSGKDLTVFQANAKAAFTGTAKEAAKSAALTEAVMKEALGRTGLDTEQLKGRFSETFNSASNDVQIIIDNLGAYKAQGIDTGIALSTNLNNVINTAQTGAELDYAKGKLVEYGRQGLITGEQVALGLGKIEQKLAQLPDTLNPAQAAFSAMGLKTQAQLDAAAQSAQANFDVISKSGQATAEGIQSAYELMLNATIASGNKAKIAVAQAKAASLGLEVQLDATGKATVSKLGEIQRAADATQRSVSQVSQPVTQNQPEVSAEKKASDDYWDNFKAEMKAKTDAANARAQAQRSGGRSGNTGSGLTGSNEPAYQAPAMPDAPMVASSFDITPLQDIQPTEKKILELQSGGKVAELQGTPEAVNSVEEMLQEFEMLKRSM
ncbi:tape measure protein [Acinetobacter tianfuensis]|uniref:Tape measure domain-containing protein n=2 Tax=Acinetobacter TaxID=469 RepID=A0A3A8EVV2_9GAMM|nr:tape measure protein [Acinetobacter tianfuensis]RKG32981.1 tape measure domain-containing protein [Acinetobacter tianfuensis]